MRLFLFISYWANLSENLTKDLSINEHFAGSFTVNAFTEFSSKSSIKTLSDSCPRCNSPPHIINCVLPNGITPALKIFVSILLQLLSLIISHSLQSWILSLS